MFVLLSPDDAYTILAASDDYLRTSHSDESILGRPLFDVLPDNPSVHHPREAGLCARPWNAWSRAAGRTGCPSCATTSAVPRRRAASSRALLDSRQHPGSDKRRSAEAAFDDHLVKPVYLGRIEIIVQANRQVRRR